MRHKVALIAVIVAAAIAAIGAGFTVEATHANPTPEAGWTWDDGSTVALGFFDGN